MLNDGMIVTNAKGEQDSFTSKSYHQFLNFLIFIVIYSLVAYRTKVLGS